MTKRKYIRIGKIRILTRYFFLVIVILVISNYGIYLAVRQFLYSQTCFTKAQVATDSRCLYVLNNKVFEKDTRNKPHKGHPCGMDVSSLIPSFHIADVAKYLDPNYKGTICVQASTSPTSTPRPPTVTVRPTLTPTRVPTVTVRPTLTSTRIPTVTNRPTLTKTPIPSRTPSRVPTLTARPSLTPAPTITRRPTQPIGGQMIVLSPTSLPSPTVTYMPPTLTLTTIPGQNNFANNQSNQCPLPAAVKNIKLSCPLCQ